MKILLVGLIENIELMNEFYDFLDSIKSFALPITEGEETENTKFIYIEKYKYDRFDKNLIENLKSNHYREHYFYCNEIDERFTNTKYYSIKNETYVHRDKHIIKETLTIHYDDIVDDLYYERYIYKNDMETKT